MVPRFESAGDHGPGRGGVDRPRHDQGGRTGRRGGEYPYPVRVGVAHPPGHRRVGVRRPQRHRGPGQGRDGAFASEVPAVSRVDRQTESNRPPTATTRHRRHRPDRASCPVPLGRISRVTIRPPGAIPRKPGAGHNARPTGRPGCDAGGSPEGITTASREPRPTAGPTSNGRQPPPTVRPQARHAPRPRDHPRSRPVTPDTAARPPPRSWAPARTRPAIPRRARSWRSVPPPARRPGRR